MLRVKAVTVAELIETLEALRASPGGAGGGIAFDGDGTLWSGDVGEDLFEAVLEEDAFTDVAAGAIAREAESHGLASTGGPVATARRILAAYAADAFPEPRVFEIMAWSFAGRPVAEAEAFAARMLDRVGFAARLHPESMAIVTWAREAGVPTFLVSASPRVVIHEAARRVGVPIAHVACATEQASAGGLVEAAVARPIPYGAGKVTHLRELLAGRPLLAAFGDNAFDVPMLEEARTPVAIRPKPRLLAKADEVPGIVTLRV
ncbi:MAG: Hydrolase, haloacid dehalogenase-like family [Labilithrix sp.]|nr:Hydrolase, haloacid dehalogenase-like family [Labilithrix sp.]